MECKYCRNKKYIEIVKDMPSIDPYLIGFVNDMSDEHWKETLTDWNVRWHKYWASPEYKERIANLSSYCHNYLSEQGDYVKTGIYPCPECYFDNSKSDFNQT